MDARKVDADEAAVARRDERRRHLVETFTGVRARGVAELSRMIRTRRAREIDAADARPLRLDVGDR
jgi:hypothetical protein